MPPSDPVDPVRAALETLAGYLIGDEPLEVTLREVARLTVEALPAARFAGISMIVDGEPRTAVFTDETAVDIDAAQYETGSGPCLDAFRDRVVHIISDTEEDQRWPAFSAAAAAHGVRSTISCPMVAGDAVTGALNLYSPDVDGFSAADEEMGLALARQAAVLLVNTTVHSDALRLAENLQEAMRSRATIEQAKGLVMATRRCTPEEAFDILVRASRRENRKLREIATEMVERAHDPDSRPQPEPPSSDA